MTWLTLLTNRWLQLAAGIALALAIGFGLGHHQKNLEDAAAALRSAQKAVQTVSKTATAQSEITASASQKAESERVRIQTVTRTIIQKVPYAVSSQADAACTVPVGFVQLHDAAAAGITPVPDASGKPDGAPSGVALSSVASTVADNYGTALENAAQLLALQQWIRDQQALSAK